ncbi:hypothetical protein [uncultured Microbulbifer sp.]|uniref:hypothetical protein n=1 Tax=uncultured Microbulbifer sp. TaxID=348147 RepID=UPI00260BE0DA|nr:hypothetical protein [uncultured Microbulbifer sp.]
MNSSQKLKIVFYSLKGYLSWLVFLVIVFFVLFMIFKSTSNLTAGKSFMAEVIFSESTGYAGGTQGLTLYLLSVRELDRELNNVWSNDFFSSGSRVCIQEVLKNSKVVVRYKVVNESNCDVN